MEVCFVVRVYFAIAISTMAIVGGVIGALPSAYPGPEFSLANDFAHSALASCHAAPQQQADGLPAGVQLALVPCAVQHLSQLGQCDQPACTYTSQHQHSR